MLGKMKNSGLVRNTWWTLLGQGARIGIQAIYFVIIARCLGNAGYGAFIGVVSLVAILAPFSGLGTGFLLIKNVARDSGVFRHYWGNALVVTMLSGCLFTVLVLSISHFILPASIPVALTLTIALSDLLFARVLDICSQSFQAFQQMARYTQLQVLLSVSRLFAAFSLVIFSNTPSPVYWGWLYLLSTVVSAVVAVIYVCIKLGLPKWKAAGLSSEMIEGFYFSISFSAQSIYNSIDKTLLARLSTLEAAGIYAAAFRIVEVSFTPVLSLVYASFAKFFQQGATGIRGSLHFAKRLLPAAGGYGLLVGLGIYFTAPILPFVLGDDYQTAVEAIRWLALIPFLKSVNVFAANSLTGAGYQGLRSAIQVGVALLSILLNILLIPVYSWKGAAIASLASETLLAVGLWGAAWYLYKKPTRLLAAQEVKVES
ncbi:oligosaccharide flippase family protein [Lihuaxuella thermophila]|uniref:Membrane protein involved in the export of O-antigen and teichoic acid n=1 Tax=Lihuaxuella thermophila TaxID=1173111 RepID=A0A1H8CEZ8_9BACL|nr:oligosaccharide flippase family protein [Lihuaxuella thermophila]SEM93552.1 Membrane protein involved in the export of O-antigen and teichoic acid [Lihuaxuella thermophila]